jgi:glutamate-1-semialdehyde 2,1-aminomutase
MTGFRLALGGAQEIYGVNADLTTLGKIIGGGLPVGAYGGRQDIMDYVSPTGPVYQAGTLSGNPLAMTAGITMLKLLKSNPGIYQQLASTTEALEEGIRKCFEGTDIPYTINRVGSMISIFFTDQSVVDFKSASTCNTARFGHFFRNMLDHGVYLPPSQFESWFISKSVTEEVVNDILTACKHSLEELDH